MIYGGSETTHQGNVQNFFDTTWSVSDKWKAFVALFNCPTLGPKTDPEDPVSWQATEAVSKFANAAEKRRSNQQSWLALVWNYGSKFRHLSVSNDWMTGLVPLMLCWSQPKYYSRNQRFISPSQAVDDARQPDSPRQARLHLVPHDFQLPDVMDPESSNCFCHRRWNNLRWLSLVRWFHYDFLWV